MYYNQQVQVQEKPTAAYYMSLIGGIIGLFIGIILLFIIIGIWFIIASIMVLVGAQKLMQEPMEHTKWGVIILVFSILGGGTILIGLIGGILALVYKPIPVGTAQPGQPYAPYGQPLQQPITRICTQCGRVVNENVKFCPHCGKQLP
jgi:hypothetical protein